MKAYFGAKDGAGVWQTIINQIPPHDRFIECFAGSAAITRHKRPSTSTIVIDSDAAAVADLTVRLGGVAGLTVICADAISWLEANRGQFGARTVIYADPPYPFEVRSSSKRRRYTKEAGEQWLHHELLAVLSRVTTQGVPVMLSGYRCKLYDERLAHWRRVDYAASTRGGPKTESLWCNFPPGPLADYSVVGRDYRERERLKRKKQRWINKLEVMSELDRAAVLAAIDDYRRRPSPETAGRSGSPFTAMAAALHSARTP